MSIPSRRGPRPLSEILGELFTLRGYGRLRARQELEEAWNTAVGEPTCRQTRLGEVRRGVLNVTVAHSSLLEELMAFRKPALLAALRSEAPATTIHDIRFRVGEIGVDSNPTTEASVRPVSPQVMEPNHKPVAARRGRAEDRRRPGHGSGPAPEKP